MLTRSIVLGFGSFGFGILNFCGNYEFLAVVEVPAGDRALDVDASNKLLLTRETTVNRAMSHAC
ncbi:hypothetical protein [Microcoleus sp. A2-C2]|uniref:hypothetical protein n=1 Tax=Microcoleus sp. A2-C2 TaxID=2818530 RepID=UPI002FD5C0E1